MFADNTMSRSANGTLPPGYEGRRHLTDSELWQCLNEADERKADSALPIDVRVRSFETYSICLREASNRGYDYASLKVKAAA